ncbi:MAG TPA: universal stress protein [Acidimicrobiales bacterium]|nr:universal stress protein [Acidimicrobiales bacterium]
MNGPAAHNSPDGQHRVVVGVDGSEGADRALEWGVRQAARTGAALEIHAAYGPGYVFITPSEVTRALTRVTDQAAARASALEPDVPIRCVTHERAPADELLAASDGADLLVVGSRGLGGFKGLLLGSVSRHCILHARCTVVVVPSDGRTAERGAAPEVPGRDPARIAHILVGVDGSASSARAFAWALDEAEAAKAAVRAVIVWSWPYGGAWGPMSPGDFDPAGDAEATLAQVIEPARTVHPSVDVSPAVVEGHPASILVDAAADADLLVVGHRGLGGLGGAVLGSVGDYCATHAPCPVAVVRDGD